MDSASKSVHLVDLSVVSEVHNRTPHNLEHWEYVIDQCGKDAFYVCHGESSSAMERMLMSLLPIGVSNGVGGGRRLPTGVAY